MQRARPELQPQRVPRRIPVPRWRSAIALYAASLVTLFLMPMGHHWNFVDIHVYRQGGLAVAHGHPLYDATFNHGQLPFTYPPAAAVLFTVLGPLSDYCSQIFATVCSLSLLPLTLRFALRLAPSSEWLSSREATRLALTCASGAIWFEPVWTTLRYGQINVLVAALILFDLSRKEDCRIKGVAIGVAAGLKITPLIFVVYLAASGRRRAASMALAAFGGTIALSVAVAPRDAWTFWVHDVLDAGRPGKVENAADQNLRGTLARLLHTEHVEGLWLAAALATAAAGLALAVRMVRSEKHSANCAEAMRRLNGLNGQDQARSNDEAGGYALCAVTGLLVSPISWTHHWVEAVPALMVLLVRAYRHRETAALIGGIAAAAVGCSQVTWRVPVSGFVGDVELHEHGVQLVASNAYVIVGLAALGWAAFAGARIGRGTDTAMPAPRQGSDESRHDGRPRRRGGPREARA